MVNDQVGKLAKNDKVSSGNRILARFSDHFSVIAVFFSVVLCLIIGFTQKPQVYPVDYGQYEWILPDVGLTWTHEEIEEGKLQFDHPVTDFDYVHFSWSNLFTPDAGNSLVYQVAIVRLFTEPFGLKFNVNYLAVVSAVLLAVSAILMTLGLRRLLPHCWFVPVIFLCVVFSNGNFCSMFRGLYPEGPAVIYSLMFAAALLYVWSLEKSRRTGWIPFVIILSFMMLKAATPLIVFLPFVITADLFLIISTVSGAERSYLLGAVSFLIFLAGCSSTVKMAGSDPDYFSNASIYESVFNTMLPACEDPASLLSEFGLDESFLHDIGKSFYMDEASYAHNPRNPEEAEKLFSKVTTKKLAAVYLRHPELLFKVIKNVPIYYERFFENNRYREIDRSGDPVSFYRSDSSLMFMIYQLLPHSYYLFFVLHMVLIMISAAVVLIGKKIKFLLAALFSACCVAYYPFCVMLNGYSLVPQYILYQHFLEIVLSVLIIILFVYVIPLVKQWLTKYSEEPYRVIPVYENRGTQKGSFSSVYTKIRGLLLSAAGNRMYVTAAAAILGTVMLIMVFLPEAHPVCVNNGDFGRFMVQMDITWPGRIYYDTKSQSGHQGIEDFEFTSGFDPLKLTPLKPSFTLYWFVSIVRVLTEPFGKPFSTLLLSWIMGGISVLCAVKITYDLYPLLKKWTIAAGLVLCMILYSETTLAWYNGFYGEGTILLGILLSMMCGIHLCLMPRHGKGSFLWMVGLAWSLYIMIGAKSQMIVTAPAAVLLFVALAAYHLPYRYDLRAIYLVVMIALCGIMAYSGLGVYQSERSGDSISSKSNMWHAYFYGIFMISDDPIGDMEKLGVDTAMAPDIGKYVQFEDDSWYVYAPLSPEADEAFHKHVSMLTIVKWYLTHPLKLWYMLDYAAKITQPLYKDFRVYKGQDYSDPAHDPVNGNNLWPGWRAYWTPSLFIGYILLYGISLFLCCRKIFRKDITAEKKILYSIPLFLILAATIQFPISVMGNGFGDNQKQMFGFELCHDLIMAGILVLGARYLHHFTGSPRFFAELKEKLGSLKRDKHEITAP